MRKNNRSKSTSKRLVPELVRVATCYCGTGKFWNSLMTHYSSGLTTHTVAWRDYTSERRMRSLAVEVTGTEERVVKRAAVPKVEGSSSLSRPNTLLKRESTMPALTRGCTTATLPRIKRFKFGESGSTFTFLLFLRYFIKLDFRRVSLNIIYFTIKYFKSVAQDLRFIRSEAKS